MKKYVLNIDKLYSGKTANALVLNQVNEDFPILIPSADTSVFENKLEFIKKWKSIYADFSPSEDEQTDLDSFNQYILNFNLGKQQEFKDKGHIELYMMDDTQTMKPNGSSYSIDKIYMHCLNGKSDDETHINSSQLSVIFPFKKISSKSVYARDSISTTVNEIDDILETYKTTTLQGKCSFQDCVKDVVEVDSQIYSLSPAIDIEDQSNSVQNQEQLLAYGNQMTIMNNLGYFPNSLSLFQSNSTDTTDIVVKCISDFVDWYAKHNHKVFVSVNETYGSNVSSLEYLGVMSYNINLGTYSPTNVVLWKDYKSKFDDTQEEVKYNPRTYDLIDDNFRSMRILSASGKTGDYGEYYNTSDGNYVFPGYLDKSGEVDVSDSFNDNGGYTKKHIGFLFNLYDNFITGNDRILRLSIPKSKDFNLMKLKFNFGFILPSKLANNMEVSILVNNEYVKADGKMNVNGIEPERNGKDNSTDEKYYLLNDNISHLYQCVVDLSEMTLDSKTYDIVVRIHFDVDFVKRNSEQLYIDYLKQAGVVISDIKIEDGSTRANNLTWGSYVNESGITDDEHNTRLDNFWIIWMYKNDVTYQTILETSLNNKSSSGLQHPNNYSTGDLWGDVFTTKSFLQPDYNMNFKINGDYDNFLTTTGRDYIGLCSCSNQLSLMFNTTSIEITPNGIYGDVITERKDLTLQNNCNYQNVEIVKNINRFESSVKHKSNVFSIVVNNTNLAPTTKDDDELTDDEKIIEEYKQRLRDSVTQFVRSTCESIAPVHTQLFDVQFT